MLQINTGKLYPDGVQAKNQLRGVLYTNLYFASMTDIRLETAAGSILQTEPGGDPGTLIYEITEQMDQAKGVGVLVSHGVRPYLNDFAYVLSFALNVTCTTDHDITARLLSDRRSLSLHAPPSKLIKRVFDKQTWAQPRDHLLLSGFIDELLGLKRQAFLAAMRAIRTYVTGLHRIPDDVQIAYSLLVASIESLAQTFDGFEGKWADFEDGKRHKIDEALEGAAPATADAVRSALIEVEHLSLARRFREFAMDHVTPDFYRETDRIGVLGVADLRDALRQAYTLRSRYVHTLHALPDMLSMERSYSEAIQLEHKTFLSLQGLARVARHIIMEFVRRQEKIETETYNYRFERHGVISVELAPEYWIGKSENVYAEGGRKHLEAFLQQFAGHLEAGTPITTLEAALPRMEEILPELNQKQRLPWLALYTLYNRIVPEENRSTSHKNVIHRYQAELEAPSLESLAAHLLLEVVPPWPLTEHRALYEGYFSQRNQTRGFRAPLLFESAFGLSLAERFRAEGDVESAKVILETAAQNAPLSQDLRRLADNSDAKNAIDWGDILLPQRAAGSRDSAAV
jgi:hypothetical protein